jgi:alpha-amylase
LTARTKNHFNNTQNTANMGGMLCYHTLREALPNKSATDIVPEPECEQKPTPENTTMLQGFEWYVPDDHKHWKRLEGQMAQLKATGIDNIWIPPACKASSPSGNGYDIYDLYDLGEFEQKGSRGTKWGTKEELMSMAKAADKAGVGIYWDAGM